MIFSHFIAQRLGRSTGSSKGSNNSSSLIIGLALSAVCISMMVMIIALAVAKGYQQQVRNKLIGFNSPIQITHLDLNNSYESLPVTRNNSFEQTLQSHPLVAFTQPYASKAGIIKTSEAFEGILLKGVDDHYHWDFIQSHLVAGNLFLALNQAKTPPLLISHITAKRMGFKLGDKVTIAFIQDPPRLRRFVICGIFDTGLGEMDELYAFTKMDLVQKLNNWNPDQISGYEVQTKDFEQIPENTKTLAQLTPLNLGIGNIFDRFPQLFDWLSLLDMNVLIIIILMIAVAAINMVTALLILILERSNMIGILKALGAGNGQISQIFFLLSSNFLFRGMLAGNIFGIGLSLLQKQFGLIKLDESAYYLNEVPIQLNVLDIVWVNIGSLCFCLVFLMLPSRFVSRINPIKTIRFN